MLRDKKALQILFDTYWSSRGWKRDQTTDAADFEYARRAGYMFDPVALPHDVIVERLLAVRNRVSIERVTAAFLASLSTRRLELRSALGSFAFAAHFTDHRPAESVGDEFHSGRQRCRVCGRYDHFAGDEDLSILNFERWKWGGVRHTDPLYCWLDLAQFEKASWDEPTPSDHSILAQIVEIASGLPPGAKPNELEKRIGKVIKSNGQERRVLIQILGYSGILKPAGRHGFLQAYTAAEDRDRPPDRANDWSYPVIWWRGADGVDRRVFHRLFPKVSVV